MVMYQLAQEATQVWVVVYTLMSGDLQLVQTSGPMEYFTYPACVEALEDARKRTYSVQPLPPLKSRLECLLKKPS